MPHPYNFDEDAYARTPLRTGAPSNLALIVGKVLQRRVFFLTGAGLSAGPPTRLPVGAQVAEHLRDWANAAGLGAAMEAVTTPDDLGEVAQAVEDATDRDVLIKQLLDLEPWTSRRFNLGHLCLALLYAEGLLTTSFTANWDPMVRRAADTIAGLRLSSPCNVPTLRSSSPPMFSHLHGCVEDPDSLVATNADLARPEAMKWTEPQLAAALGGLDAVLVGFAAEPEYVLTTVQRMRAAVGAPPVAVIGRDAAATFAARSPDLAAAVDVTPTCAHYVQGSASEILGEITRCCYRFKIQQVLTQAVARARALADPPLAIAAWAPEAVESLLLDCSLGGALRFIWQAAELPASARDVLQPALLATADQLAEVLAALMLLASCSDVESVALRDDAVQLTTNTGDRADVWPVIPEEPMSTTTACSAAYDKSPAFSRPGDELRPLVLLCARTDGVTPTGGHPTLVGSPPPGALTDGRRAPTDVVTLTELHRRLCNLAGGAAVRLRDVVTVT